MCVCVCVCVCLYVCIMYLCAWMFNVCICVFVCVCGVTGSWQLPEVQLLLLA